MADIAIIYHWSPDAMDCMPVEEIMMWRDKAVERFNQMNSQK